MSLRNTGENPSPADILEAARELDGNDNRDEDADTSTDLGREAVREFVERLDAGETVRVRARRILVEIGRDAPITGSARAGRTFERGDDVDPQDIGRTLAAMRRGVAPDDYLPHVSVSAWRETGDGGLTTWEIEVGGDE
jgi:hypothetical protein